MNRTLIVATTSYAGMGPYVSEIVNSFYPQDDVYFFFVDYEDNFFRKNIKKELWQKSIFYKYPNSAKNKIVELITNNTPFNIEILSYCSEKNIDSVHYINCICSVKMQRKFADRGIVVWGTVHDLHPHEASKAWHKMMRHRILHKRLADNLRVCKNVITNSMLQFEELKQEFRQKRIEYHSFPSLVTKEIISGNILPPELKDLKLPYLLFFGRIEEYKGISLLYEAFKQNAFVNSNHKLVIAGSGQLPANIDNSDTRLVLMNRYIKDGEVKFLYEHAKAVVYPYISATQSGVLSLAFYFNTPVVASDVPFFKSIIEDSQTGVLFKTGAVTELSRKLQDIIGLDCNSMKENQRKYYKSNYNAETIRERLLEIYGIEDVTLLP